MNDLIRVQAYESLKEMNRKMKSYAEKPDANQAYLNKNKFYISALEKYIDLMEREVQNTKFNSDFLIVTESGNQGSVIQELENKVKDYQQILKRYGIDETDQAFMLHSNSERNSETRRFNSIERAKETWPELY